VDYKKTCEDAYFDSFEEINPALKTPESVPDLAIFEDGEYVK